MNEKKKARSPHPNDERPFLRAIAAVHAMQRIQMMSPMAHPMNEAVVLEFPDMASPPRVPAPMFPSLADARGLMRLIVAPSRPAPTV